MNNSAPFNYFFCIFKNWGQPSPFLAIIWSTLQCRSQFMFWVLINCCFCIRRPNLESLIRNMTYFLCCGICAAFLAFKSSKTKNTGTHEFLRPINPKKLKKLWKFEFFHIRPLFWLSKFFLVFFSIFPAFWHLLQLLLLEIELVLPA